MDPDPNATACTMPRQHRVFVTRAAQRALVEQAGAAARAERYGRSPFHLAPARSTEHDRIRRDVSLDLLPPYHDAALREHARVIWTPPWPRRMRAPPSPRAVAGRRVAARGDTKEVDLAAMERVWVIGAGKAACGMAMGARRYSATRSHGGTLTTKDGHGRDLPRIEVWEAAPSRSRHARDGGRGGGPADRRAPPAPRTWCSACFPAAPPAVGRGRLLGGDAHDLKAVTDALLRAGATIHELNAVRKHLSRIGADGCAGGGPPRIVTLP